MIPRPSKVTDPSVGWVSQLPVVGVSSKRKVSQMKRYSNGDKAFSAFFVFAALFYLAWVGFLTWAIYTLVSWLVTK